MGDGGWGMGGGVRGTGLEKKKSRAFAYRLRVLFGKETIVK